jgi:mannose-6-phosphate isomerase
VTEADVIAAVESGRFEDLLVRHDAKRGDAFFIPGGLVHAIGDGVSLYEVQQSSDTTFRLYDWGRVGDDGRPRALHVEASLQAMDLTLPVPAAQTDVSCDFFDFRQVPVSGSVSFPATATGAVLFAAEGEVAVNGVCLPKGKSAFVGVCLVA